MLCGSGFTRRLVSKPDSFIGHYHDFSIGDFSIVFSAVRARHTTLRVYSIA